MVLYITEMGAIGDGIALNTDIINEAIDKVHQAGGGQVIVPPGIYISGAIFLKSNVQLYLEAGARILGAPDASMFPSVKNSHSCALVGAYGEENISIDGYGILELNHPFEGGEAHPLVLYIRNSKHISIRGVTLYQHGGHHISECAYCENITYDSLIMNSRDSVMGDGFDITGCKNVTVNNCKIVAGDDAISMKTGNGDYPCENVTITNCMINSNWAGIRVGPESTGDMRNFTVSNCVFNDCSDALKIQLCTDYQMEDMTFSNLVLVNTCRAFCLTYRPPFENKNDDEKQFHGKMRRLHFSNIIAKNGGRAAHQRYHKEQMIIQGMYGAPIEDLFFSNVKFICSGGGVVDKLHGILVPEHGLYDYYPEFLPCDLSYGADNDHPSSCMFLNHVENVTFVNCEFETIIPDERPAIVANDVKNVKLYQASTNVEAGLMCCYDVEGLTTVQCDGEIKFVDGEQKAQCDAFKKISIENTQHYVKNMRCKKAIPSMTKVFSVTHEVGENITVPSFMYNHEDGKKVYLHLGVLKGTPVVIVNGKEAYRWERGTCPTYNDGRTPIYADISDAVSPGENTIEVVLDGDFKQFRSETFDIFTSAE